MSRFPLLTDRIRAPTPFVFVVSVLVPLPLMVTLLPDDVVAMAMFDPAVLRWTPLPLRLSVNDDPLPVKAMPCEPADERDV